MSNLRAAARVGVVAGAAGSVGLMIRVSQHPPPLLLVLFAIWVVSPFVVLIGANVVSPRWSTMTRATLYGVTLVIALCTLAIYGYLAFTPQAKTPTAVFVLVPPASWLLTTVAVSMAALISRRRGGTAPITRA
jgi:hypothetical protein